MPARFAILHHTGHGCEHWDLMIEHENALLTWQLLAEPIGLASLPIDALRIASHRKRYLEYEGAVSRGRGTVRKIDTGTVRIQKLTDSTCLFTAEGVLISGPLSLSRRTGDAWVLNRSDISPE